MYWVGVDVGGTFTDVVLYDSAAGMLTVLKTPSTPADQSEGIVRGVSALGVAPQRIVRFGHGSTVATNTALERNGARTAVLVTRGHRDVLVVGRGNRTQLYDIKARQPRAIVERDHCFEITERIGADGRVIVPMDVPEVERLAAAIRDGGFEAVAVCFLHSYANPAHELAAAQHLRSCLPDIPVALSHEIVPEYREHERFFTTALSAYVGPRVRRYLAGLRQRLARIDCTTPVGVMTSAGGVLPDVRVEALPVLSMLSGPAAGVIAARFIGRTAGVENLITYDMGGTSTDVCVLRGGQFGMTSTGRVGAFPTKIQQIDINSVGAGGGSVASVGAGGVLSVGPRSAGALPGPCCYGRGGVEPTVTDANVFLGRLGTEELLGGEIRLDRDAAAAALSRLARKLAIDDVTLADGILRIAVASMTAAIKEISIMRGLDPRDYTLLAFGGAGPLHAAAIAEELGMPRVLVPPMPGNFSAFGLLVADIRRDFARTRVSPTRTISADRIRATFADLVATATAELADAGVAADRMIFEGSLDMRYTGQAFELSVPIPVDVASTDLVEQRFRAVYAARYGEAPDGATEIVSYRIAASGITEKPDWRPLTHDGRGGAAAVKAMRRIAFGGAWHECPVYDRRKMPLGVPITGPLVIEEAGSTTIVPAGWTARLDAHGSILMERVR
jgi:N-methylhydantoinase A